MARLIIVTLLLAATLAVAGEPDGYVGLAVGEDNCTVIHVESDSPAARAGVVVGDRIIVVEGRPTHGIPRAEFAKLVVGAVGNAIQLDVQRSGTDGVVRLRLYRLPRPTPAPTIPPDFSPHQASSRAEGPSVS